MSTNPPNTALPPPSLEYCAFAHLHLVIMSLLSEQVPTAFAGMDVDAAPVLRRAVDGIHVGLETRYGSSVKKADVVIHDNQGGSGDGGAAEGFDDCVVCFHR